MIRKRTATFMPTVRALAPAIAAVLLVAACSRSGLDDGAAVDADASAPHDASPHPSDASTHADASDAAPGPPPSCAPGGPGLTDCGAASESCCTTLPVPDGTFFRTYVNDGTGPTGELDPAIVSGLRLDAYEVTVARFRRFVSAWNAGWRPAPRSGKHAHLHGGLGLANAASPGTYEPGWDPSDEASVAPTDGNLGSCGVFSTWTPSPAGHENLPIDCVTWPESYAFCIWDGGFLPSEAEWELAAAAGTEQREYPWGSAPPGTASQYAIYGCYYDPPDTGAQCDVTTAPGFATVGTPPLGAGKWGQVDLGGNVWEETMDAFLEAYVNPCVDCAYLAAGSARVVRGGCFISPSRELVPTTRFELPQAIRNNYVGLRCARAP